MSIATEEIVSAEVTAGSFIYQPWKMKEIRRMYVNLPDGTKVGYLDLATLESVPESTETAPLLAAALAGLSGAPVETQAAAADVSAPAPAMSWHDLSGNRPGHLIENLEELSYQAGVAGEQRTAGVLAGLERCGYRILHSLPLSPRKDLDHLIIGPTGVFAVNTKSTTYEVTAKAGGPVYSDGYRQNWLESIERDAGVVAELLSAAARMNLTCVPLVSVWSSVGVRSSGGSVVTGENLPEAILGRAELYPPAWVDVMFNVARRSDTWPRQGTARH